MQAEAELSTAAPSPVWWQRFPLRHLRRRFWSHLTARGLHPGEQRHIAELLDHAERRLFYAQSTADQRHGYATLQRTASTPLPPDDARIVQRAALLHDVGKADVRLGPVGRSFATVFDIVSLPLWPSASTYRRHGEIGAGWLADMGAEPLVVDFARRHPDPVPGPHPPLLWRTLLDADDL